MLSNNFGRRLRGVEVRLKCCWRDRSVWCRRPFNIFVVLTKAHATILTTRVKQREGVWGGWMTSCMAAPTQNRRRGRHRDFLNLGHFRPLFPLFLTFQQFINFIKNFADDWIRTWDLWYLKRPLCQLSHNHFQTRDFCHEPWQAYPILLSSRQSGYIWQKIVQVRAM